MILCYEILQSRPHTHTNHFPTLKKFKLPYYRLVRTLKFFGRDSQEPAKWRREFILLYFPKKNKGCHYVAHISNRHFLRNSIDDRLDWLWPYSYRIQTWRGKFRYCQYIDSNKDQITGPHYDDYMWII